ncbi:MAG: SbcC/MukB-like Walker B domain-containing protein [Bacillota bacterium]|jgi:uncharacterized protein YPO0396
MWNLFSADPGKEGYRLQYMEVYNWGTFHHKIYRIHPQGNTSLLTGANGSGKTTWIDALLTLIVPERKYRFYNQSSGTERKGDRSEETYVLGNYGDIQEEGKLSATVQQLRPDKKNVFAILLANFENDREETVTLFQTRWFVDGNLKRTYGIAYVPLAIKADFTPFDPAGNWKKKLEAQYRRGEKRNIEFFDGPQKYAERLIKVFGMRSIKALPLFNQTVGIKVLGNLDDFIRTNMLEQQDTEGEFVKLKENFYTLVEAQKNIEKAELKISLLQPIKQLNDSLNALREEKQTFDHLQQTARFWFATRKSQLLAGEIANQEQTLAILTDKIEKLDRDIENRRSDAQTLVNAIQNDQVGQRIAEIEKEIKNHERDREQRRRGQEIYNGLAASLGLPQSPDESLFYENYQKLAELQENLNLEIRDVENSIFELKKEAERLQGELRHGEGELQTLLKQTNNITGRVAEIRTELLADLGISQNELPFVGELIRVRAEEKNWEAAVERLLHNFALRLIVPERYYEQVNRYVNQNNLNGRIVYHKFRSEIYLDANLSLAEHSLLNKLESNPNSEYSHWVEHQIRTNFDYRCTANLEEFQQYKRALAITGLIKTGDRHEKDDRPQVLNRENYVLGWDNKEKIRWWQRELKKLNGEVKLCQAALKSQESLKQSKEALKTKLTEIGGFRRFEEIDWQSEADIIHKLRLDKKQLEQTNNRMKELQNQLETVNLAIKKLEQEIRSDYGKKEKLRGDIVALHQRRDQTARLLAESDETVTRYYELFESKLKDYLQVIHLDTIDDTYQAVTAYLGREILNSDREINKALIDLQRRINHFKNPSAEILEQFNDWRNETFQLPEEPEYVDEYLRLLQRLEQDDLPSFKRRFADYLSSTMLIKIADFKQSLDEWQENIEENIRDLNDSLRRINFRNNPETYIQLRFHNRTNVNVREFRQMLSEAFPVAAAWSLNEDFDKKKIHFTEKIIPLINKLDENTGWRSEVIDVRNWKNYYAEERYRESDRTMKTYLEMGSLSGGEKAQLTYTILGSALAYQFGITASGLERRSFRFIAVDESFSNQDEEKATYLMDLCKQLNLQLLVVTPCDKIHIVEPYISYVHYIERVNNRESVLYDMPIMQFQEEREKWLTGQDRQDDYASRDQTKSNS